MLYRCRRIADSMEHFLEDEVGARQSDIFSDAGLITPVDT